MDELPDDFYSSNWYTDQLISYIDSASGDDAPFFAYLSFTAAHNPLHVPQEYIEKYRGRFDGGWDALREEIFQRQQAMGIVPESCELTDPPPGLSQWDDYDDDMKAVLARQMEVFAGYLEHCDHHIGRMIDAVDDLGVLDDTVVMVLSDNGASQEGGSHGTLNELSHFNGIEVTGEELLPHLDETTLLILQLCVTYLRRGRLVAPEALPWAAGFFALLFALHRELGSARFTFAVGLLRAYPAWVPGRRNSRR